MKENIKSLLPGEIADIVKNMGQPSFRAGQIFKWLHSGVKSFDEMSNIPKNMREALKEQYYITYPVPERKLVSKIDGTVKYLWRLNDGNTIESVIMKYEHGNTICISSQVGCRMGCAFCASTLGGKVRDLEASEILDQVMFGQIDSGLKISNIVMMGIGEPLDNFDNVIRFLSLVNDPDGLNIGMRHISLSTCGLVEKIDKLAEYNLQLTLSVSLHAPNDEIRNKIMPVNRSCSVELLLEHCYNYYKKTGRRISFEYAMIDGVNDTAQNAAELADRLKRMEGHVNLIPLNHVEESPLKPSTPAHLKEFISILKKRGINVTVRRKLGSDINASCGQLRRNREQASMED